MTSIFLGDVPTLPHFEPSMFYFAFHPCCRPKLSDFLVPASGILSVGKAMADSGGTGCGTW